MSSKFDSSHDIMYRLCQHSINNLFDFENIYIYDNISPFPQIHDVDSTKVIVNGGGDWHAPYQIKVVNNADGDAGESQYFTGGMHGYKNATSNVTPTARNVGIKFFDGVNELSDGDNGLTDRMIIEWVNNIQAYNTMKSDGTGREVLQEHITMCFDGYEFETKTEFKPFEDINCNLWYGLQVMYSVGTDNLIRYIGATNRLESAQNVASQSDDNTCNLMRITSSNNNVVCEMKIDSLFDLGKRTYCYSNLVKAMFGANYGKGYATIINNGSLVFNANCIYVLNGKYRWHKNI